MVDMSKAAFHIVYDGPALATHEMSVNDLAPALLAFGDLVEAANETLNGSKRARVTLNVKASFKTGCFGIELDVVQTLLQQVGALFSAAQAVSAQDMLRWLGFAWENGDKAMVYGGGLIWLMKRLAGQPIRQATRLESGLVRITIEGAAVDVESQVIELYRNARLRKALDEVLKPLDQEGIDEFAVTDKQQSTRFVQVSEKERPYFSAPSAVVEELQPIEVEANLQLVSVSFRQDNKWRFSEGDYPFYATVLDKGFLLKVQRNEPFSAGDRLRVRMRKTQKIVDGSIRIDYEILEVLDHQRGSSQIPIIFDNE
ncbi:MULTISPECIES: hypothetical protein [Achromobacter]|uniref:Uncharacterized protein n=1 Tax=Achromobacter spanius TaxID=217203 RepID=A0ABY8GSJ7_9BURK|nr:MULTISPECIES: hypothetical protein [Achromobacter]WAI83224.1 hypothetical protein N8Z00_27645 [Achromobacter spanius]WEX93309.1 hypothetical protein N3Z32_22240 [Achromobacter sp. SS2-2022]WFP07533.1 hypothetical protein P8T11_25010 [Achromobacter spanius]